MKISLLLQSYFERGVRNRGQAYFASRVVQIMDGSSDGVYGTVQGGDLYHVALGIEGDELHMSCDCPYFAEYGTGCKHLWATILAAQQRGYLHGLLTKRNFRVVFDVMEY